jgi:hypothetical protein
LYCISYIAAHVGQRSSQLEQLIMLRVQSPGLPLPHRSILDAKSECSFMDIKDICLPNLLSLFAIPGTANLRKYIKEATLVPVDLGAKEETVRRLGGHRSHKNTLSIRPEHWRRLRGVQRLHDTYLDLLVADCELSLPH